MSVCGSAYNHNMTAGQVAGTVKRKFTAEILKELLEEQQKS